LRDAPARRDDFECQANEGVAPLHSRYHSSASLRAVNQTLWIHWRLAVSIAGGMLIACFLHCLIAPKEYEAKARLALRIAPASALSLDGTDRLPSGSFCWHCAKRDFV
jgi:hypothetical protein